jgi:hypothetical protein
VEPDRGVASAPPDRRIDRFPPRQLLWQRETEAQRVGLRRESSADELRPATDDPFVIECGKTLLDLIERPLQGLEG